MDLPIALLLIDVQEGFNEPGWGARNQPGAEEIMAELLQFWRRRGWPLFHVRHDSTSPQSPLRPGQPGNAFQDLVAPHPGEPVIAKNVNSAFIGTDLQARLHAVGARSVAIAGLTTNHCVSTTARMAANLGFQTVVVADATAAYECTGPDGRHFPAQLVHDLSLANLHEEFATVLSAAPLMAQLR